MKAVLGYSAAGLAILAALVLPYWPPARSVALFAIGRAGGCSLRASFQAPRQLREIQAAVERMRSTTHVVERRDGLELWRTEHGLFWVTPNTVKDNFNRFLAEDEVGIYGSGPLGVRSGDVVLDCGAAHGTFTRTALEAGARLVVAIEPVPANVACLRRTFAQQIEQGRVIVCPKGVWDKEDELELAISLNPYESTFTRSIPEEGHITVPLITIDRLVKELRLERVDFIKMDIEGAEQKALVGAAETLKRHKPRLAVSANHRPDDPVEIPARVLEAEPSYRLEWDYCEDRGRSITPQIAVFH